MRKCAELKKQSEPSGVASRMEGDKGDDGKVAGDCIEVASKSQNPCF